MIKKYFSSDCSEEEKRKIYLFFRKNPSLFLDQFSEEDFISAEGSKNDETIYNSLDSILISRFRRKNIYRRFSLVAMVIFLLGVSIISFYKYDSIKIAKSKKFVSKQTRIIDDYSGYIAINTSSSIKLLTLPDHSLVKLYPQSKISYLALLAPAQRNVLLEGTAIFNVAHDVTKPFTVFCGEVATTALGTEFKVSTEKNHKVIVQLLQGKIRVSTANKSKINTQTYYLLPGNSIVYDSKLSAFTTINNQADKDLKISINRNSLDPSASKKSNDRAYSYISSTAVRFEGASLQVVLDYLAESHQVKISYPSKIVGHIRFVGTLKKDESLDTILKNIAIMNNLSFSKDTLDDIYILRSVK